MDLLESCETPLEGSRIGG